MRRAIHIIPFEGIGGVESAARSLVAGRFGGLEFGKYYLVRLSDNVDTEFVEHGPKVSENSPRAYLAALCYVLRAKPDLVIASLWRSAIVLVIAKLFRPSMKAVVFLHSPRDVHRVDRIANRLAMELSDEIWTDSQKTMEGRVPRKLQHKGRVISFLLSCQPAPEPRLPYPNFIFWGRLHPQKGLSRALVLFARICRRFPHARFLIIGPDGGDASKLKLLTQALGIEWNVEFAGAKSFTTIVSRAKDASFYLQTSTQEGMAIAVVEAMQQGLVPVVTPVGEIAAYCMHAKNAIIVDEDEQAAADVISLIEDADRYRRLSYEAAAVWSHRALYWEDVIAGSKAILGEAH